MTAELSLVLSMLALGVSVLSIGFTAYQQYFKRPTITILLPRRVIVWYEHDGRLYLNMSIGIRNVGAQYGSIRAMVGTIAHQVDGNSSNINWLAFLRSDNIAKPGEAYRPIISIEEVADILVIPGRTTLTKHIQFITEQKFELAAGIYLIDIYALEGLRSKPRARAKARLSVSSEVAQGLPTADKETHLAQRSVTLTLQV